VTARRRLFSFGMSAMTISSNSAAKPSEASDEALLDLVQRQTFRFFWEGAHPVSGLARDRTGLDADPDNDLISVGGSGFGVMAIIVAASRGWIAREEAAGRINLMLAFLERTTSYHGLFPHFMNGRTGATVPFGRKDDGGDIVETAFLFQGLLCARRYFDGPDPDEKRLRDHITWLWREVEWNWHAREGRHGWSIDVEVRGWNECLIAYILAAAAPRYAIDPIVYHSGWAQSRTFANRREFFGIELPLGPDYGGPLFFSHYSFCALDPRGLQDAYADYFRQNVAHTLINYEYCVRNPKRHVGFGPSCWGLTASDDPAGYAAHAPDADTGVISPTAALSSFPYAPDQAMRALRYFHETLGERLWGRFGFVDAFSESAGWFAKTYLAIDQGPIVAMIENYRTGLLWRLFMADEDVRSGLKRLGFQSGRSA
jgi:hypothetical protein